MVSEFVLRPHAVATSGRGWSKTVAASEPSSTATWPPRLDRTDIEETERKTATIVFADLIGSTELSRSVDLDCWWSMLGCVFEDMCESVRRFGGWVEGFTGDGIMAVFESRLGHGRSEHARRACEAALWLRDAMARCSDELEGRHGTGVSVRIGVHSGEVLTGTIGRRYGRHYTAGGYAVAIAKRIETLGAPGAVYVSEQTAAQLEPAAELQDLGTFTVKGAREPVHVYELLAR
jgi:adenylate cyclase